MTDVFEAKSYKQYLNDRLDDPDAGGGRGARARLSQAIGCQTAYTAQVLRGSAHFSLEQGEAINEYLGHTDEQGRFFLLLIQRDRAGSVKLRQRFEREISDVLSSRLALKNRLGVHQSLSDKNQLQYYSSWYYSAVHALTSIPGFQSPEKISRRLGIDSVRAAQALELLLESGLLVREKTRDGEQLKIGVARIHLPHDSPLISKHHINWRLQAIRALEKQKPENLHYSSVISISEEDYARIREVLVKTLESIKPIIRDSKEEKLKALALDLFEV
ncbi:MAG: TIGR02147 family protein [Bdellovibrionia bacterium]